MSFIDNIKKVIRKIIDMIYSIINKDNNNIEIASQNNQVNDIIIINPEPENIIIEPTLPLKIIKKPIDDYIKVCTDKKIIVLHYTAGGTLSGAEAQLSIKNYINVTYGLDDDGTVYQYIEEKYYCYHTGMGAKFDAQTIGVEIRNWGHLDDNMRTWTGKQLPPDKVIKLNRFRGYQYWEKLTPAQIIVLPLLLNDIKSRWGYDKIIITHAQVKPTKLDFPPDFPLIKDLITIKEYPINIKMIL